MISLTELSLIFTFFLPKNGIINRNAIEYMIVKMFNDRFFIRIPPSFICKFLLFYFLYTNNIANYIKDSTNIKFLILFANFLCFITIILLFSSKCYNITPIKYETSQYYSAIF